MEAQNPGLSLQSEHIDSIAVMRFSGDICLTTLNVAKTALQNEIDSGFKECVIDLDDVNYMDSSGIGFLLGALKRVKETNGGLRICRLNTYLAGLFRLLQLNEILEITDSIESAVSSLKSAKDS